MKTIYFICFSHVLGENAKVSSDQATDINLKKIKVNAQITAMTSFLEFLTNITFVIHVFLNKGTTFSTMVHSMILYCILLPSVILLNTDRNKARLITEGWKKTIVDCLKISKIFNGDMNNVRNIDLVQDSELQPNKQVRRLKIKKQKDNGIFIIRIVNNEDQITTEQRQFISSLQNPQTDIVST